MPQPTFLYVENDEMSREVMRMLLTRGLGYPDVIMFENSADFETRLDGLRHRPDVIFLDIHMEPIDGFEMLDLIRKNARYDAVAVVALTASVMYEEVRRLRDAGFDGVIAKPINFDTFPAALDRILSGGQVWNTK
ncbi:MAG TPA: response regulator [Aggregatilineales bacterium]|jgi:CheY-like chemotaxis protein|nr:response regulator [Aggregatilineales bacterium]